MFSSHLNYTQNIKYLFKILIFNQNKPNTKPLNQAHPKSPKSHNLFSSHLNYTQNIKYPFKISIFNPKKNPTQTLY
ncbi:hypothetical protein ZOSMA_152G00170 [Zostera marina]|uniref:Uncharacterized protein n=1 Tax=Zostera marina TaxID=29655 RepID=A0A0K9PVW7_ZOSMR|nr:hypothetical protein ZOSMA_152G00170 [Zostera marina]